MSDLVAEVDCPYCAEKVNGNAKKCKHCGEILDHSLRDIEHLKSQQAVNSLASTTAALAAIYSHSQKKKRTTALLWCFFLGGAGAHKFYLGKPGLGIVYLLFSWTFIPVIIALLELIYMACMNDADFDRKYNNYGMQAAFNPNVHLPASAQSLENHASIERQSTATDKGNKLAAGIGWSFAFLVLLSFGLQGLSYHSYPSAVISFFGASLALPFVRRRIPAPVNRPAFVVLMMTLALIGSSILNMYAGAN